MAISTKDIAQGIYEGAIEQKGHHSAYYENVVKFLAKKKLLSKTEDILKHLKKIVNKAEGRIEAKVSTSHRLGATERYELIQALKKRYGARDVALTEVVDEKLLGGMKVEVNDELIDLTTKGKILKLQTYLMRSV